MSHSPPMLPALDMTNITRYGSIFVEPADDRLACSTWSKYVGSQFMTT